MPRIIVPTRNRPVEIGALLEFLARFYPKTSLTLSDGGNAISQDRTASLCEAYAEKLDLRHLRYPTDLPLFERLIDTLLAEEDDILALGADDDFPLMEVQDEAAICLSKNAAAVSVVPGDVVLHLIADGSMIARLSPSRTIAQTKAAARVRNYGWWPFATSYGVARRAAMIERYRTLSRVYCAGFIDLQIGVEDCLAGTLIALPRIGSIRTQTYTGSYNRPADKLIFLRRSDQVLEIRDHIRDRLSGSGGCDDATAESIASNAIANQIAHLTGGGITTRAGITESERFRDPMLQRQFGIFHELFTPGTPVREAHLERMRFIATILRQSSGERGQAVAGKDYEDF